jgi:arginyl-tRNA synthetase
LQRAAVKAQKLGKLPLVPLPEISVERPQNPEYGDYATSFPLRLARTTGLNPLAIASSIAGLLVRSAELASIAVTPPGFINFTFKNDWLTRQVAIF